jgi:hypothetical protein
MSSGQAYELHCSGIAEQVADECRFNPTATDFSSLIRWNP